MISQDFQFLKEKMDQDFKNLETKLAYNDEKDKEQRHAIKLLVQERKIIEPIRLKIN